MTNEHSRRSFLRTVPLAATVSLSFAEQLLAPVKAEGQAAAAAPVPFQSYTAEQLAADVKALQGSPGNKDLFIASSLPLTVVMTTEMGKAAKEFEWHEGRDHVVQIVEGATLYEVGGTPKNAHSTKPGEWLAPACEGSRSILMGKGDMLVIPRGTPHKRSTEDSVTLTLISTPGVVKA